MELSLWIRGDRVVPSIQNVRASAEELELFNDSKKKKREENRNKAKERKKAEKLMNPNFMPLGPSPKPKDDNPAKAGDPATAAATQAERIGQLNINADKA